MNLNSTSFSSCLFSFCLTLLLILSTIAPASANPVETPNTKVWLVSENETVSPGETIWVALRQQIRDGWHTYWRNPGDSGEATAIEWQLPDGLKAGEISWPYPEAISYGTLLNYGYHGDVFLLVPITAPQSLIIGEPIDIRGSVSWLVCEELCIPEDAELSLQMPTAETPSTKSAVWSKKFETTRLKLPQRSPWPARFSVSDEKVEITLEAEQFAQGAITLARFFPYKDGIILNTDEQRLQVDDHGLTLQIAAGRRTQKGAAESVEKGVIVLTENVEGQTMTRAVEIEAQRSQRPVQIGLGISLAEAFLFALLGGLILNVMPCVLPVLSLKALDLVRQAEAAPGQARVHGTSYAFGVILSFVVLAMVLITLRAGGDQIGWGFHLQSPITLTLLVYVMVAVGLSFLGVLSVGTGLANLGGQLASKSGAAGSFFTGVLATVVATPCTVPFMGAAAGYALTQPALIGLTIFAALGLGMALPFLVLSFVPRMAAWLPKPGAWMETFKQFLAFPMFATAVWLIWVLSSQAGSTAVLIALVGSVLIAFGAWVQAVTRMSSEPGQWAGRAAIVGCTAAALLLVQFTESSAERPGQKVEESAFYEPYTEERLRNARQAGQPVFLNLTADWCITCKLNEGVALSSDTIATAFREKNILYLKGDWTRRDARITNKLSEYGRAGVPLYVLYPPTQSGLTPQVLPQLLTENIVLEALDKI